jgi:hypothetical protein
MSEALRCTRLEEQPGPGPGAAAAVDPGPLLGIWHNTNSRARGILRLELARRQDAVTVRVRGVGSPEPIDWGEAAAEVFAHDVGDRAAMAFSAVYDLGFSRVHLQANVKQGVLVVASFNEFTDDSGRASYFTREFFFR